jgi:hypothetical protein
MLTSIKVPSIKMPPIMIPTAPLLVLHTVEHISCSIFVGFYGIAMCPLLGYVVLGSLKAPSER